MDNISYRQALSDLKSTLEAQSYPQPDITALQLLAFITSTAVSSIYAINLDGNQLDALQHSKLLHIKSCLVKDMPIALITGAQEFYGLNFYVDNDVLIPRSETELLVEMALDYASHLATVTDKEISILEIGLGTGCISTIMINNLAQKGIRFKLMGIDPSPNATGLSVKNMRETLGLAFASKGKMSTAVFKGNHINIVTTTIHHLKYPSNPDIIVSNPPYLTTEEYISAPLSVRGFEPRLALDGGIDGLEVYNHIGNYIVRLEAKPAVFLEISPTITRPIKDWGEKLGYQVEIKNDLSGKERFAVLTTYA